MPAKLVRRVLLGGWTWAWWILARLHIRTMARSACADWRIAGIVSLSRRLSSVSPVRRRKLLSRRWQWINALGAGFGNLDLDHRRPESGYPALRRRKRRL